MVMTDIEITRETDDAVYYTCDWGRKANIEREVRRAAGKLPAWDRKIQPTKSVKYMCVGGPLHGKKYATIQMNDLGRAAEGYFDYNNSGYDRRSTPKMLRVHFSLMEDVNERP